MNKQKEKAISLKHTFNTHIRIFITCSFRTIVIFTKFRPMQAFYVEHTELRTTGVDFSNSVNRVQVLTFYKYPSIFICSRDWTYRWFDLQALFKQTPISVGPCVPQNNSFWIWGIYKLNDSINPWDTTHNSHVRFFFTLAYIAISFFPFLFK